MYIYVHCRIICMFFIFFKIVDSKYLFNKRSIALTTTDKSSSKYGNIAFDF